ncbi:HK97 gp10 family phage protein [Lactobacillus sp. ESL0679]|uniref:HK97 gp10 family phage protein n=1 Tax=Lactobacillus sp. ESL0679 TaxID=2983209 RepID=UPI0023F7F8E6|nr:HK97 gp10 family phage protein [Lactobacillus sp. ESL0679]MDF7683520.1 HK97 gp10 family phage protein [Lactobacillus sp. ESL0679]
MSLGTVDDAEFKAFTDKITNAVNSGQLKQAIGESAGRIGQQSLKKFKANTPIGKTKVLGRAWQVEGPHYDGMSWSIKLSNNTKYASYVENGHRTRGHKSWVPGQFFMERSKTQIESQLPFLITPLLVKFRNLLS